ncbi:uncharacterized protein, partial [Argopecten irradians]|uniref:uncharacterized protein n=1 Tax=Argopecten irradians TaxID=31199 RepID=UPI0037209140
PSPRPNTVRPTTTTRSTTSVNTPLMTPAMTTLDRTTLNYTDITNTANNSELNTVQPDHGDELSIALYVMLPSLGIIVIIIIVWRFRRRRNTGAAKLTVLPDQRSYGGRRSDELS